MTSCKECPKAYKEVWPRRVVTRCGANGPRKEKKMADFVRFKGQNGLVLVNADNVVEVRACDEPDETCITCIGEGNWVFVNEPFEDVAAKLNRLFWVT